MSKTLNAGKYNTKIQFVRIRRDVDNAGFKYDKVLEVLTCWASVKTTRGMTLIANNSDFEKAYTNFTIRYPKFTTITRDMKIKFNDKMYSIEYLNNIDEKSIELEIQAKEVSK